MPSAQAAVPRTDPLMVKSVMKAFSILHVFTHERSSLGLTQIATLVEVDKSTAQRFTHTLEALGYLYKDPETKRFELTVKALGIASSYLQSNKLVSAAFPYLTHLNQLTGETVNLAVLDGTEIVFLSRFVSSNIFKSDVTIGTRLPAYCTAAGRAILSRMSMADVESVLEQSDLRPFTPHTLYQRDALLENIAATASRGYSRALREYYTDDLSFGAPILDSTNRPIGAITIAVSGSRYGEAEAEEKFAREAMAAANSIKV